MDDYGEHNKINFKQFIFLLAKFRQGKVKSLLTDYNTRESKLRFLFDVSTLTFDNNNQQLRKHLDV